MTRSASCRARSSSLGSRAAERLIRWVSRSEHRFVCRDGIARAGALKNRTATGLWRALKRKHPLDALWVVALLEKLRPDNLGVSFYHPDDVINIARTRAWLAKYGDAWAEVQARRLRI